MVESEVETADHQWWRIVVRVAIIMLAAPFVIVVFFVTLDITTNELIRLDILNETRSYAHPEDSYRVHKVSQVGNFSNSNGCDVIVADIRASLLPPDALHTFYMPVLRESKMDDTVPLRDVHLYVFDNPDDRVSLERWPSPDLYWKVASIASEHQNVYIMLSSRTEYPPNLDGRCH